MSASEILLLGGLIFAAAVLYTSVGHAGASGYLAAMALFGLAPTVMKPTALTMNILVCFLRCCAPSTRGACAVARTNLACRGVNPSRLHRRCHPAPRALVPCARRDSALSCRGQVFRCPRDGTESPSAVAGSIPLFPVLLAGGAVGLLSGLTGTGGGIFLSPLLMLFG